jgi:hypothetical protein
MKIPSLLPLVALLTVAAADTIVFKDGRRLEGQIIEEKDDHYVALVQFTETIRDQREIPKSEVEEIITVKADEVAFEKIADLTPTPDLLSAKDYEARILQVEGFLEEHPESDFATKAAKILETLDREANAVRQGGVKFEGELIDPEDRQAQGFVIDSRIAARQFTQLASAGQRTAALRAWRELDEHFASSQAYREAIDLALALMRRHLAAIEDDLARVDERLEEQQTGLAQAPRRDRNRMERAIARNAASYKNRVEEERQAGIQWLSLDPLHPEPMQDVKRTLEREIDRLEQLDPSSLPDGNQAWKDAWETVSDDPDSSAASEAIREARSAGIPDEYLEDLEALQADN